MPRASSSLSRCVAALLTSPAGAAQYCIPQVIDLDTPDDDITEIQKEVALLSEMRDANRHNITLYHGCYLHGYELWIAMDFASGGSIRTLVSCAGSGWARFKSGADAGGGWKQMKSGPIEEKYIVLILREVLVALSFLHRQAIIHRDVKGPSHSLSATPPWLTLFIAERSSRQHSSHPIRQNPALRFRRRCSSSNQQQALHFHRHTALDGSRGHHRRQDVRHQS